MRARLNNELERVRAHEARLAAALVALDEGKRPDQIMRHVMNQELRRGGGPDRAGEPRPAREPTPEEREHALAMLDTHAPEMAERLRRAHDQNPRAAARMLERIIQRQREIAELEKWNSALATIKREEAKTAFELQMVGQRLREAAERKEDDPEPFEAAHREVRALLGRQFDLDTRAKQNEIDNLSVRVDELQTKLNARASERESLIDKHLERFLTTRPERMRRGQQRD